MSHATGSIVTNHQGGTTTIHQTVHVDNRIVFESLEDNKLENLMLYYTALVLVVFFSVFAIVIK